jgi:hypothetical protein
MFTNYSYLEDDEYGPRPRNRILIILTHYEVPGSEIPGLFYTNCRVVGCTRTPVPGRTYVPHLQPIIYIIVFPDKSALEAKLCTSSKVVRSMEAFQAYMNSTKQFMYRNALCSLENDVIDKLLPNVEDTLKANASLL